MAKVSEQISKANSTSQGKTDSNLANDSNHLGGIPAEQYATQEYVRNYHDTKEANQKNYIDTQDQAILEQAKEYANSQIRNQDFSNFAKVPDVQALKTSLETKITDGDNKQKAYTDQKTQAIVNDVNENFDQVETAINKINKNVNDLDSSIDTINSAINGINSNMSNMDGELNQLFQSVSNGKSQIAGAITDKGVPTSATDTFSTMAGNIRSIPTSSGGGGDIPEGYVNTNDANAVASDLLVGKTAYVKGEKIFGTLIAEVEPGQPTYGLDTSDATASPGDVVAGKTFYARGQKMTGTLYESEIEEIYGVNSDNPVYKQLTGLSDTDPVTEESITNRDLVAFSKNLDYCVCRSVINEQTYVESYAINDDGIYIQGDINGSGETTYKKYRYSYVDLGLSADEEIQDLELTAPGFMGYADRCLLVIVTRQMIESPSTMNFNLHIYTYNLTENGVIGKMYDAQKDVINHVETLYTTTSRNNSAVMRVASFNLKANKLYAVRGVKDGTSSTSYTLYDITLYNMITGFVVSSTTYTYTGLNYRSIPSYGKFTISSDDKYASFRNIIGYSGAFPLIYIDIDDMPRLGRSPKSTDSLSASGIVNIKGTNIVIQYIDNYIQLYTIGFDTDNNVTTTLLKKVYLASNFFCVADLCLTNDNRLISISGNKKTLTSSTLFAFHLFEVDDILNADNDATVNNIYGVTTGFDRFLATDNNTKIFGYDFYVNWSLSNPGQVRLSSLALEADISNVIGLKYKGNYFYRQDPHILTAGQPDVRAGKTFIGWMGTQEVGTMEVDET